MNKMRKKIFDIVYYYFYLIIHNNIYFSHINHIKIVKIKSEFNINKCTINIFPFMTVCFYIKYH